jgi:hypothetical protein
MRRNKKKNIFTSHTLKYCPDCCNFCYICKGACKAEIINGIDSDMIPENHPVPKKKLKSHKFGIGSLRKGRTFVRAMFGRHRCCSRESKNFETRKNKEKRISDDLQEQLVLYRLGHSN